MTASARAMEAVTLVAATRVDHRLAAGETIGNPGGLARTIAKQDLWPDLHQTATDLAEHNPGWSAAQLAHELEPDPLAAVIERVTRPPAYVDHAAAAGQAQYKLMQEHQAARQANPPHEADDSERARVRALILEARAAIGGPNVKKLR